MNPILHIVTVGHITCVVGSNRRPTEREDTVKPQSERDMEHHD